PLGRQASRAQSRFDVGLECGGMTSDAPFTRVSNRGRRFIGLLHHGADEASELRNLSLKERLAKADIGEDAIERICVLVIRRLRKKLSRHFGPVVRRSHSKFILTLEVMKESALGHASCLAKLIHG